MDKRYEEIVLAAGVLKERIGELRPDVEADWENWLTRLRMRL